MFSKVALLAIALSSFAAASPSPVALSDATKAVKESTPGLRIPLQKRGLLTRPDGTFNYDQAIRKVVRLKNKHRNNLLNLEKNKGFLPQGFEIKPLTMLADILHLAPRGAVELTDQSNDLEWTGPVTIGTPPKTYTIDFDTGSADLWVPSSACTSCGKHVTYNVSESSTGQAQNGNFSIHYGDGSTSAGPTFSDTVTVGGVTVKDQHFAAVTSESSQLREDVMDGLMGMGFPELSRLNKDPFMFTAISQGAVSSGEFAFKLDQTGSELFIGGTNPELYTGEIEYHPVLPGTGFWMLGNASVTLGGASIRPGEIETLIDSGSTLINAPPGDAVAFWQRVPGASALKNELEGMWQYPCNATVDVAFNWGGKEWKVSAEDINYGKMHASSDMCVGAVMGADLGLGPAVWLLGDSFMKNTYTVFSVDKKAVGFAQLA